MTDADAFARHYLFVNVHDHAGSAAVAELLEAAAAALRSHGEVTVQHIAFEVTEITGSASTSLTLYYDRVERRRHDRQSDVESHPSQLEPRTLRAVD